MSEIARMSEIDVRQAEFEALRATIRERGTARLAILVAGFAAWGALALGVRLSQLDGAAALVPFAVLVAAFEINFFIHIGVERIGRYLQVFHEERASAAGWETIAMKFGARSVANAARLDPLFSLLFFAAAAINFFASLPVAERRTGWIVISLVAHLAFNYRIVRARRVSATQRANELEHFRTLANER
jgi:hypothetical protein